MEIRNSDWTETFAVIFLPKISFLAAEEGHQPPYGGPTRVRGTPRGVGRAPLPRASLGHRLAWIFLPKNHIYSKKISVGFYPVWTPFDMDILRNKNMQQTGTGTGHWINMLVPKNSIRSWQKYMKVV